MSCIMQQCQDNILNRDAFTFYTSAIKMFYILCYKLCNGLGTDSG